MTEKRSGATDDRMEQREVSVIATARIEEPVGRCDRGTRRGALAQFSAASGMAVIVRLPPMIVDPDPPLHRI